MGRAGPKRTWEEIANKSDSNDEDYDDRAYRASLRTRSRSKKTTRKKSRSTKKRRRRGSDDDFITDDDELVTGDEELSYQESESDDPNVERNARGIARRKAARNRPVYKEESDEDEDEEQQESDDGNAEADEDSKPQTQTKKSNIITLKVGGALKRQFGSDTGPITRRTTRQRRGASEELYALTSSGRHVETVGRSSHTPEPQPSRGRQGSKTVQVQTAIQEEESPSQPKPADKSSGQLEVLESTQGEVPESFPSVDKSTENHDQEDVEMGEGDGSVVPESQNGDAKPEEEEEEDEDDEGPTTRRSSRPNRQKETEETEEREEQPAQTPRRSGRKRPPRQHKDDDESDFEPPSEEEDEDDDEISDLVSERSPRKDAEEGGATRRFNLRSRKSQSRGRESDIAEELAEELESLREDRSRRRRSQPVYEHKPRRNRKDVDYRIIRPEIPFPADDPEEEVTESPSRRGGRSGKWERTLFSTCGPFGGGGTSAVLAPPGGLPPTAAAGVDSDSSDDETLTRPGGTAGVGTQPGLVSGAGYTTAQPFGADPTVPGPSGTPANFGRIKDKHALADADPLGIDPNVSFDSVGGLQGHIDQLKEMVLLPLLYPEIFQRFKIVPPRGVLFHGPPGTGKTLMARALASSVSSEGRKVTFYMRKGADALSKWVGEAERQLRLLFEEARKTQPSIIFFDEIDGLAPVRSSKQEQIHASIVSTLLALMDGMDGRGQVIVIGATNRPDSIDPALRRPGRFDREFYFPLPDKEGRRAILDIHTRGWDPPLPDNVKDELAELTKGFGGADLRALCTEAALNAVQRRYPQIYRSSQKLQIDPKNIVVTPKDFMMSLRKMVPSSERSTSSGAAPLPKLVESLLRHRLDEIRSMLGKILPQKKQLTALEEAEFEEPEGGSSFRREQMKQEFETARVFRPRLLIRGPPGMGQHYLASAVLYHCEGIHVQSFDLSTLLSDSTRSPETTVVHLFAEVKRRKPSVIYIPNVQTWYETVGQTVISTFLGLLRSVPPTDPVLLLGVLEEEDENVDPVIIKSLFGYSQKNVYTLTAPDEQSRHEFFARTIDYVRTSPSEFPEPENRKKRKLEELPVVPPPPSPADLPPTKEQLKAQKKKDHQTLNILKIRIQPIMDQIKKYKRFRTGVIDESQIRYLFEEDEQQPQSNGMPLEQRTTFRPFEKDYDKHGVPGLREVVSGKFFYNLEIVTIEKRLSNGYYKRPKDFLADIKRVVKDARQTDDQERILRANELLSNVEVDIASIEQSDPAFVAECEQVYLRELERERLAMEKAKAKAAAEAQKNGQAPPAPPANHFNVPHGNSESSMSTGPIVHGPPLTNGVGFGHGHGPVTPMRPGTSSTANNGLHGPGGGSDLNESGGHGSTEHASRAEDGDTYMTNSDISHGPETMNSSFGQSAQPRPLHSHTAPSQQIRRESGLSNLSQKGTVTPMAPGSQPGDYANDASTTQTTSDKKTSENSTGPRLNYSQSFVTGSGPRIEYPDLTSYPDRISLEENLPDTQQEPGFSQPSAANGSQSQPRNQGFARPPPRFDKPQPTHIQSLLNNDEPSPTVDLNPDSVEELHEHLTRQTSGCSVEQLEQIHAALMDTLWSTRSEWDRNKVARMVRDRFDEVLRDIRSAWV